MNKNLKVFLVFLLSLFIVGMGSSLFTEYTGVSNPVVPVLGTVPVIGAGVMFGLWYFWLRKDKSL